MDRAIESGAVPFYCRFEVVDPDGRTVARGEVGGDAVAVPAGRFTLRLADGDEQAVGVAPGEVVAISVDG